MRRLPRGLVRGVGLVAVGYLLLLGLLMLFEEKFIFFPSPLPEGDWDAATRAGIPAEDVWLRTTDDVRIHGWWLPAQGDAKKTILFLHGNAGNLTGRLPWMHALNTLPANVLIIDYRGYGRSEGVPDEEIPDFEFGFGTL